MTYSRQQRERAVDLYIKYEHSAADVIHELGYPSRTILYVWYRERLEEERAGVPSGRGQRHRRYSDGQNRAAVAHCLEYGSRPGRTIVFCQIFVGRFGVSFSPFERLFLGRFGFGQSCGLSVIA